ncbi:hypothetical protein BUALT_Bualt03G0181800 [Buddleja alternifolia]|uniref:B box-type domain-containing protein n=1 Tax=Buddleja alternifolia TaxID=168488 RepID=A0AAV6Y5L2_9LAMI|nr:hypothetical protein BUALT_Bualt03G0181800 [Buddleja alternifolia]
MEYEERGGRRWTTWWMWRLEKRPATVEGRWIEVYGMADVSPGGDSRRLWRRGGWRLKQENKIKLNKTYRLMKIQCDVCEAAKAQVVCCADEAALCGGCDLKIHAQHKLAARHHRLQLFPSAMPICNICHAGLYICITTINISLYISLIILMKYLKCSRKKINSQRYIQKRLIFEALGFFFCLEHRAVACRKCDITTHKANSPFSSNHHRLLLTGVKVALDPIVSNSSQISSYSMPEFSEVICHFPFSQH